ncbi:MAG: hypothetical protein IT531_09965 [Burkholderiales bacterium]|nr:hypothetical protein [Burkholderiales bacterium]
MLRLLLCLLFLAGVCVPVARANAAQAPVELAAAQRAGWDTAAILAQGLAAADPRRFPGIHAWLKDYRAAGGVPGKRSASAPARLDAERLVTRNASFWRAYFELRPGDGGTMLLHAATLLAGGEASRAAYVLLIARQSPDVDKEMLEAMNALLQHAQGVLHWGAQQAAEAARLHDEGAHAASITRSRAALEAWPANGLAHYELGLALLAKQYLDGGRKPPARSRLGIHSELAPAVEALAAYARAREHDPLLIRAYQGNEMPGADSVLILGKSIRPPWDIVARDTQAGVRDETLRALAGGLAEAGIAELALAVGQVLIGREGGYDDDDRKFMAANLRLLAPAAVASVLKRLGQPRPEFARIVLP